MLKAKIEQLSKSIFVNDLAKRLRVLFTRCRSTISHQLFFPWILSFIPHLALSFKTRKKCSSSSFSDSSKALNKKDTQKKAVLSQLFGGVCFFVQKLFLFEKYLLFFLHALIWNLACGQLLVIGLYWEAAHENESKTRCA